MNRDAFIAAYIEAALFSTNDESTPSGGHPLDQNYSAEDLTPACRAKLEADCDKFIASLSAEDREINATRAGHDLWFTANGHGCGFWDGDWPEGQDQRLTKLSEGIGETNLCVTDDGHIDCY